MSASLDDMPEYEHFQDELDLELKRYQQIKSLNNTSAEHSFIQHVCFTLFLKNPSELSSIILSHILHTTPDDEQRIMDFIQFIHSDNQSFLKNRFSHVLPTSAE